MITDASSDTAKPRAGFLKVIGYDPRFVARKRLTQMSMQKKAGLRDF